MTPFISNTDIYVRFNKRYLYRVDNNKVIKTVGDSALCEEHEEVDSRSIYIIFAK